MKIRGFGDLLGFKQSGLKNFKLADPVHNEDLFILGEQECVNNGDGNSDSIINVLDGVLIVNYIFNTGDPFTDNQLCSADLNGDSVINILDIVAIVNIVLGGGA